MTGARPTLSIAGVVLALGVAGCRSGTDVAGYAVHAGGDPAHGQTVIAERHCGVCHEIPAVVGAHGVVGHSLAGFARRSFIAGGVPNTVANTITWIRTPQRMDPRTAMPALGINEPDARDVVAYLLTLR